MNREPALTHPPIDPPLARAGGLRGLLRASLQAWLSNERGRGGGPWWLPWLFTLLFSAALAVPFTLLGFWAFGSGTGAWRNLAGWAEWYGRNLVVCLTISAVIHLLFDLGRAYIATPERVARWRPWQRSAWFAGVPMLGVTLAWPLGVALAGANVMQWLRSDEAPNVIAGTLLASLTITTLMHQTFSSRHRRLQAEQRATEAQLRLLQAQIEPHFLFNTLANVHALIDHEPATARAMLGAFTDYLRASLGTLRRDAVPLADELALAEAYLRVQQLRMGDRLRYTIDADAAARQAAVPPLLLQPLVENAVLHGVEPQLDGGTVRVRARLDGTRLVLEVLDDGPGPNAPRRRAGGGAGNGIALANVRERLLQRHGPAATLTIEPATPAGTRAALVLPATAAPAADPTRMKPQP